MTYLFLHTEYSPLQKLHYTYVDLEQFRYRCQTAQVYSKVKTLLENVHPRTFRR